MTPKTAMSKKELSEISILTEERALELSVNTHHLLASVKNFSDNAEAIVKEEQKEEEDSKWNTSKMYYDRVAKGKPWPEVLKIRQDIFVKGFPINNAQLRALAQKSLSLCDTWDADDPDAEYISSVETGITYYAAEGDVCADDAVLALFQGYTDYYDKWDILEILAINYKYA